ncbi:small GTP-binding protein [Bradyrhizobium sp. USDA 4501]|uniref:Rab family GTPase n=1 Tax=Bradyrhizobium brasilense TaxID=1419277 RepID=UPI0014576180|nr:GTP-binding protein [Bradyrhizobium brasilense]MCP3415766.1 GTP-binding protein [Bradyrhizobium brasilense]NLS71467.1 GTP-binding protein [Bradyrhizobium brasilense]
MLTAKVMLLGDMGVGKTSILYRLIYNRFEGQYKSTLGVEILSHDVAPADGSDPTRLVLWDTDGDFGTQIFDTVYVTGASAAIIVSDVTRPQTVTRMVELVRGFEERFPGRPYRALLNKIDLPEAAGSAGAIAGLAKSSVKSVSAKTGVGIAESFVELAQTIRRRQL